MWINSQLVDKSQVTRLDKAAYEKLFTGLPYDAVYLKCWGIAEKEDDTRLSAAKTNREQPVPSRPK